MVKDDAILDAAEHLRKCLGQDEFQIMDHWEADLIAVGIASPSDLQRLVYFSLDPAESAVFTSPLRLRRRRVASFHTWIAANSTTLTWKRLRRLLQNILEFVHSATSKRIQVAVAASVVLAYMKRDVVRWVSINAEAALLLAMQNGRSHAR
jgi:hypothetical protein